MDKMMLFFFVYLHRVYFVSSLQDMCNTTNMVISKECCTGKECPELCVENYRTIRITSAVNGTGSGTLLVCGKNVTERLTIMAGKDEIFPLSTRRYEVNVSESRYYSTVNITVHNLTERDQGIIPLFLLTCRAQCIVSQIWVDLKGSTDQVNFSYTFGTYDGESYLKLICEATGYPRLLAIMDVNTKNLVSSKTSSTRNYQPTMLLKVDTLEPFHKPMKSYICEVTDFLGNNSTHILHGAHTAYPPRIFNITTNNSVIKANINETVMFSFDVISSGDVNIEVDSNRTQTQVTRCGSINCFNVLVLINFIQESDFRKYTVQIAQADNKSNCILVYFTIQLNDHPQFCYDPNPNYTIYTRPSDKSSVNFCLKSGVDIQHQHKMEVYVDKQRLSDKDIQLTKYNSRYQYGLDIVLYNQTFNTTSLIIITVFNVTLKCRVNIVINATYCNNEIKKSPIPASLDQLLTIQFCVVSSSHLHDHVGINGHVMKVNTSHVTGLYRYVGVRRSGDDTYNVTIQLYPADVDGVQIYQVLVKNVERETMPYMFQIKLLRETKTSIRTSYTSIHSTTTLSSLDRDNSSSVSNSSHLETTSPQSVKTSSSVVTVYLIISAAAAVVVITIIIIVVIVYRKKVKTLFESKFSSLHQQTNLLRNNYDYSLQTFDTKTGLLKNEFSKFLIDRSSTLQSSDLEDNNIYINAPERSLNSKGLNYITVDHSNPRDSLSTNRSSHSQDHVVYVKLDFQKMAKKEIKKSKL